MKYLISFIFMAFIFMASICYGEFTKINECIGFEAIEDSESSRTYYFMEKFNCDNVKEDIKLSFIFCSDKGESAYIRINPMYSWEEVNSLILDNCKCKGELEK